MSKKETITYDPHLLVKPVVINDRAIKQIDISSHCDKHLTWHYSWIDIRISEIIG